MNSTLNRPAVDLAADRPRPGLALVLALLSLPGSTIAWELPAGGLWIGLPLAIAAIVLGIRARRRGMGTGMATVAVAIAALAVGQMAVFVVVSALS
jgi:tetrahydromethanopterin S-methyltransferase subunit C